ncbi:Gamma-tubulin complex component GCP5, putative [Penicillium digitatum]|uniref:Spindle pole body component n=3 Tax=Penicillium digitatum TaxID=36651 RepID=K9GNE0_PEND2|nr:Gamma-tubulin complex component GCP5, putative [Penicillium digitatum Pd1]EKV12932.1 Gamma-tubulin complex component GCP5, putative [Penicillium digitatum Pd1]EKV14706.1 Gamma-tubulin complex component GCP5, putative [Penicillium digitatum PHI26]QQK43326.1 Gamma-tubulin complex component GCP5, putative [Penicillium digitatum]
MALAADLSTLIDALITSVAKIPPDQKGSVRVQSVKRRVQGSLRTGSHTRTDQFAVTKQLEGLQEKFQILNRDELAEALHNRIAELENNRTSWHPEILSLFLQLSDRPALLSTVKRPEEVAKAPEAKETLSWSDLNAEGTAFSDEEIWEQVDFAGDSSDDDFSSVASDVSLPKHRPQSATTVDEGYNIPDEVFVPAEDEDLVASLEKAQFWRAENHPSLLQGEAATSRLVTESQLARETIFMLQGLPTSIYVRLDDDFGVDRRYTLAHSSSEALASLLQRFSEIGAKVNDLRRFTKLQQTIPYMQTFCRGLEDRLLEFDRMLSQVQCKYLSAGSTVSLIQLLVDVRQNSHELVLLAEMITKLADNSTDQPMCCLDSLYNLICMLEALGDESTSQRLAGLFFMCFKTYSSSIRLWMETGQVDASDSTFFVRSNRENENRDLRTLWHDWFVLDTGYRQQRIPQFLEAGVQKVFTAGKSMVFLRYLNAPPDIEAMRFEDLYSQDSSLLHVLPFPALVESAFEKLVDVDHSLSASFLRTELDQQCGLWSSLDALQHVYLAKDMSAVTIVDAKIFELIDRGRSWDDRFLLTEISRTAFSSVSVVDTSRLLMRPASTPLRVYQNRTVGILEAISIDYGLSWPIANIVTEGAMHTYQRISTFLMQIRRAKHAMVKQRVRDARITTPDDNDKLVHALHHNMLWVLDFIYGHLTYLVISTATRSLQKDLSSAQDVDAMIGAHQSYMSSLEAQCLLRKDLSPIHDAIINFLDLCVHFADLQAAHLLGDEGQQNPESLNAPRTKIDIQNEFDSDDDDDDEEEDYDHMNHEHTLTISFRDSTYSQQMKTVNSNFNYLTTLVTDGLKNLARADDGLQSWDILADKLEWRRSWHRN